MVSTCILRRDGNDQKIMSITMISKERMGQGEHGERRTKSWYVNRGMGESSNIAVSHFFKAILASLPESAVNIDIPPLTFHLVLTIHCTYTSDMNGSKECWPATCG